jgi:hypothetical protein
MSNTITPAPSTNNLAKRSKGLPAGHRALYVAVPEQAFNHAKAQAYLSGMPWKEFIRRLLSESKPFPGGNSAPSAA